MKKNLLPTLKLSAFIVMILAATIVVAQFSSIKNAYFKTFGLAVESSEDLPVADVNKIASADFSGFNKSFSGIETAVPFARTNAFIKNPSVQFERRQKSSFCGRLRGNSHGAHGQDQGS